MAEGIKLLEAFVGIFADDGAYKATLAQAPKLAQAAGAQASRAFQQAVGTPITAPDLAKPFKEAQASAEAAGKASVAAFRQAGETLEDFIARQAKVQGAGDKAPDLAKRLGLETAPAALAKVEEGAKKTGAALGKLTGDAQGALHAFRVLAPNLAYVNPILGQMANLVSRSGAALGGITLRFGLYATAAAVAAESVYSFVKRSKEALDASVALDKALLNNSFAEVSAQAAKTADELQQRRALSLQVARGGIGGIIAGFELSGRERYAQSTEALEARARKEREAQSRLFQTQEAPKLLAETQVEQQQLLQRQAELQVEAAGTTKALRDATEKLTAARTAEAEAQAKGIELLVIGIESERAAGKISEEVAAGRIKRVKEQAAAIRAGAVIENDATQRATTRRTAEIEAVETEHTAKLGALMRQRTTLTLQALQEILSIEGGATRDLDATFRERETLQRASTQAALRDLEAEIQGRRAATSQRLAGSVGDERVRLEQSLTELTQEQETRRTQITLQGVTQRAQAVQQRFQAEMERAESLFQLQRTLGQRSLQDEIARQRDIVQAAEQGSTLQIAALRRVADLQSQLRQQAQGLAQQGLAILDRQSERLGLDAPEYFSQADLDRSAADQKERNARTKETLKFGGGVNRKDYQDVFAFDQFFEQFKDFGNRFADVFKAALTPLKETFEQTVGPALAQSLADMNAQLEAGLGAMVSAYTVAWKQVEQVVSATMGRLVQIIRAGELEAGNAIADVVEERLARSLASAPRR